MGYISRINKYQILNLPALPSLSTPVSLCHMKYVYACTHLRTKNLLNHSAQNEGSAVRCPCINLGKQYKRHFSLMCNIYWT